MVSLNHLLRLVDSTHPTLTSTVFQLEERSVVVVKHRQLEKVILDSTVQMFCQDFESGGSVLMNLMTFNKKLIQSKLVSTEESLETVLTEFQRIECRVCQGFQPEDIEQVDLSSILIEKYNEQLLYRSKDCLYVSQRSDPPYCCSNCQFLKETSGASVVTVIPGHIELIQPSNSQPDISDQPSPVEKVGEEVDKTRPEKVVVLESCSWPVNWSGAQSPSYSQLGGDNTAGKTLTKKKTRGRPIVYSHPCNVVNCNEIFSNLTDLKEHKKSRHKDLFKCSWPNSSCSKSFPAEKDLEEHLLSHSSDRPYKCQTCGKTFASKKIFKEHKKLHSNSKAYVCDICNKSFARKDNLEVHQSVHTKERPFLCLKCGKTFSRQSHLSDHDKRSHQEIRRYICLLCTKSFFTSQQLTRHSRTHSKEKPYHCSKCDKTFSRDHHLKIHTERLHVIN